MSRKIALEKEIAALYQELNAAWAAYVRPHAAGALVLSTARKGKALSATNPLPLKEAELLNRTTETGAFEYGRSLMKVYTDEINAKRTQARKLAEQLDSIRRRSGRGDELPLSVSDQPVGNSSVPVESGAGMAPDPGEWLRRLRVLVQVPRAGIQAL